jgi:hydrogenase expression/formation protein HypD
MEFSLEFRERGRVDRLLGQIRREATGIYNLMEVCGGHTSAIHSYGIPSLLPHNINLISGPGCPVCVTSRTFIDHAIALASMPGIIIATFGDLLRVPGTTTTLEKEKAAGKNISVIYSVNEALSLAVTHKNKKVVFLAIGFETTAPGTAAGVLEARDRGLFNFLVLSAQKTMPPAMRAVVDGGTRVNGFICPGHVSAITGSRIYMFLPREFGIGCVIAGFEPVDILYSVLLLVRQINRDEPRVEIQYKRAVRPEGNLRAVKIMNQVFTESDDWWRGFGIIPCSGLQLREEFEEYDAWKFFHVIPREQPDEGSCMCGDILRGKYTPADCPLFGTACTPGNPAGACMVSSEGACNTFHKYGVKKHNY